MSPIRLNPELHASIHPIAEGLDCVVVDDFLAEPEAVVQWAQAHRDDFEAQEEGYPGEVLETPAALMEDIYGYIRRRMSFMFGFLRGDIRYSTLMSVATRQPGECNVLQRMPHTDPGSGEGRRNFAALVYLFDDPVLGGTGFYRWTDQDAIVSATRWHQRSPEKAERMLGLRFPEVEEAPRFITDSTSFAERLSQVEAKFNRMVFYSGDIPHSAQIAQPERLTPELDSGRLTLNVFASVVLNP